MKSPNAISLDQETALEKTVSELTEDFNILDACSLEYGKRIADREEAKVKFQGQVVGCQQSKHWQKKCSGYGLRRVAG